MLLPDNAVGRINRLGSVYITQVLRDHDMIETLFRVFEVHALFRIS